MKKILLNGLILGVTLIVIYLVLHFIEPRLNYDFTIGIVYSTIVSIFFLVRAGFQQRKSLGGYLGFSEVFVASLAIFAIGSFIIVLFTTLMIKFNPELLELMREMSNKTMASTMRMMDKSPGEIALAIEEANENGPQFTLSTQLVSWIIGIILPGCIYALITSLITKKKKSNI